MAKGESVFGESVKRLIRRRLKVTAHPYEGLPLVLVTGIGRSGTTVLRHALGAHADVDSTGTENNIIQDVLAAALYNCTFESRKANMHVAPPAYHRQFGMLFLNLLWPQPRKGRARPRMLMASSDVRPDQAEYLCEVLPGTRYVYIVRNGIEVVSSRMAFRTFMDKPFEWHCEVWSATRKLAAWGAERRDFLTVRHEELLDRERAEQAVRRILEDAGLRFRRECVDVLLNKTFHPTQFENEKKDATADLSRRAERWRLWTDAQRRTFGRICGDA
ncbi:sulfotransferase, partial [Verrucomicrobiota bacterium]